ncbi:leucine Rich repeat-containing domain protein [Enterococcus faecalis 13-SD-W-01]|nr:leucine Rich repeat-containing domain protein [Enterococcus faecalis 13-SD-W-01]
MNKFLTVLASLSLILGIAAPIDSLIEYSFEETQITEELLEKESAESSSSEQSTEMTTQESTVEMSTSSSETEETMENITETQPAPIEETSESTQIIDTAESTTNPESTESEAAATEETEQIVTVSSGEETKTETNNLPDDTVITMSPGLLRGIAEDVALVAQDKIIISELKKVKSILVLGDTYGKVDSLEGLQYAENLHTIVFAHNTGYGFDIADLSPLSNLDKLRNLYLPNSKVTDFRPLKKMAENITQGIPVEGVSGMLIDVSTRIDARQMNDNSFDPFNNMEPIKVNSDGETWDFEMPFHSYDGSRLETKGGDVNYIDSDKTARIGSDIENIFQINLSKEINGLLGSNVSTTGYIHLNVEYISELKKPTSPFAQKLSLRGILTEIDRETLEQRETDYGIVKEIYGYVGETINARNELFEESKPIREIFTGTIQRKASEETIHYVDKAIDNGLSYVQLNYKGINENVLKPSVLHIRAADTNFTLPSVPEISGYGLIEDPPERIRTPAEGETLDVDYIYGEIIDITDPVLEREIRKALAISDTLPVTDYAMQNLEILEYDAGESGERITDVRSLQYAKNLQKLILINQEIGSTLTSSMIQKLTKLNYLDLSKNNGSLYISSLHYVDSLTYLNISENRISMAVSEFPPNLEILEMKKMKAMNFAIIGNPRLTSLKRLNLSDNGDHINNTLLLNLIETAKNGNLEYVDLSNNHLSDLSVLSEIEDLNYYPAGSSSDFMNDLGWNFADQKLSASKRLTAGKEVRLENVVKSKNGEIYLPKSSDADFRMENNEIIWMLGFNEDGSLKNEKAVFQYNDYENTNYSAELTVELNYQPLKIEIPLNLEFSNNASAENIKSKEYQIKNLSEFPIEIALEEVADTSENPLPLVEQVVQGIEGIALKLKTSDKEINLAGQRNNVGRLDEGNTLQFALTGDYFAETSEEKQFAYSFQFTFKESGDSIEKKAE